MTLHLNKLNCVVIQSLNQVWLYAILWTVACQASLSFIFFWSLLKLMSIESVMSSNHLILCTLFLLLPLIFPSITVFSNESHLWVAKVLELQLLHQSFQWIFRTDFLKDWLVWSPCSPRDSSRVFSTTIITKTSILWHQPSLLPNSHIHTWLLENMDLCWQNDVSAF